MGGHEKSFGHMCLSFLRQGYTDAAPAVLRAAAWVAVAMLTVTAGEGRVAGAVLPWPVAALEAHCQLRAELAVSPM